MTNNRLVRYTIPVARVRIRFVPVEISRDGYYLGTTWEAQEEKYTVLVYVLVVTIGGIVMTFMENHG